MSTNGMPPSTYLVQRTWVSAKYFVPFIFTGLKQIRNVVH